MKKFWLAFLGAVVLSTALPLAVPPAFALGGCGPNGHRNPWGVCVPNGAVPGYVAPVVVTPAVVAPAVVVAPRFVCPYGYYFYTPYNRCVPTP